MQDNEPLFDDDMPEALQLHAALAVACLALDLIASGTMEDGQRAAQQALNILRRRHPVCAEHIPPTIASPRPNDSLA
jgi:hypothetical protein